MVTLKLICLILAIGAKCAGVHARDSEYWELDEKLTDTPEWNIYENSVRRANKGNNFGLRGLMSRQLKENEPVTVQPGGDEGFGNHQWKDKKWSENTGFEKHEWNDKKWAGNNKDRTENSRRSYDLNTREASDEHLSNKVCMNLLFGTSRMELLLRQIYSKVMSKRLGSTPDDYTNYDYTDENLETRACDILVGILDRSSDMTMDIYKKTHEDTPDGGFRKRMNRRQMVKMPASDASDYDELTIDDSEDVDELPYVYVHDAISYFQTFLKDNNLTTSDWSDLLETFKNKFPNRRF